MRRAALALVLLSTPAGAAPAPHGPGCRLSTAQCVQVARELAIAAELNAEDARIFGFGLSPYDRAKALLRREYERAVARRPLMPVAIANEVAHVRLCLAKDEAARLDGGTNNEPECR